VNTVPVTLSGRKSSPIPISPRAFIVANRADVPVPQGDRSMQPMKLFGLSQLDCLVDMVTALRGGSPVNGREQTAETPPNSGREDDEPGIAHSSPKSAFPRT
jgi:hypothetical protein